LNVYTEFLMDYKITKYCKISANEVIINGEIVFHQETPVFFDDYIRSVYQFSKINYLKFFKMDNLSKLGFITSELLIKDTNINDNYDKTDIGIVINNSQSSLDTDKHYFSTIKSAENYFPSPSIFVYTLPNIMIGEICIRNKIMGENAFFVSQEFNHEHLHKYISNLFLKNKIQSCICGWVDLLGDTFQSVLMLVEKSEKCLNNSDINLIFEPKNLQLIYNK